MPPRWSATVTENPGHPPLLRVEATASDVTVAEVAHALARLLADLSDPALARERIPTVEEEREKLRAGEVARSNPATTLWFRRGEQRWTGPLPDDVRLEMEERGWTCGGRVETPHPLPCAWTLDPVAFRASL